MLSALELDFGTGNTRPVRPVLREAINRQIPLLRDNSIPRQLSVYGRDRGSNHVSENSRALTKYDLAGQLVSSPEKLAWDYTHRESAT